MRWFSTEEICEILSRFEKVIILGDSMMRHVVGSINVLIRKDLGYGAVTDWNFSPEERYRCSFVGAITEQQTETSIGKTASAITNSMSNLVPSKASSRRPTLPKTIQRV